jgi:hypothetical protein
MISPHSVNNAVSALRVYILAKDSRMGTNGETEAEM